MVAAEPRQCTGKIGSLDQHRDDLMRTASTTFAFQTPILPHRSLSSPHKPSLNDVAGGGQLRFINAASTPSEATRLSFEQRTTPPVDVYHSVETAHSELLKGANCALISHI